MSSTDELHDRIGELEDRVADLEALVGDHADGGDDVDEAVVTDAIEWTPDGPQPKEVIADIPGAHVDGVRHEQAIEQLRQEGFDDPDGQLNKLRREGEIYEPQSGLIKVV